MTLITLPRLNQVGVNAWASVQDNDVATRDVVNGQLDDANVAAGANINGSKLLANSIAWTKILGTSVQAQLGVNDGTTVSRGKSIIATEESRTNVAYGLLTTPDRVQNIVLPSGGLMMVAYQAMWKDNFAANAAIFLGVNQLKAATPTGTVPLVQEASHSVVDNTYKPLSSCVFGLEAEDNSDPNVYTSDVITGQTISSASTGSSSVPRGGPCYIFAAAGTYDVSVQFKSSGTVTVKNRNLWVWTLGF